MADDKDFDFNLPDLPSDEELGISPEDYDLLDEDGEIRPDPPEGKAPASGAGPAASATGAAEAADPKLAKAAKRAREKAEKAAAKQARQQARAAKKAAKAGPAATGTAGGAAGAKAATGPTEAAKEAGDKAPKRRWFRRGKKAESAGAEEPPASEAGAAEGKPPPQPPGSKNRGPLAAAVLLLAAFASASERGVPRPVPANAPADEFSSARAMTDLIEIAQAPHPPGSPEHARVRGYLEARLTDLGLDPQVQTTTALLRGGPYAIAATVRNVVARLPGRESTGSVLLTAHYDGHEGSFGAGDDGSGVVAILEALRAVQQGEPLRNDVIVLISDAEELGLLGAKAFVEEHPWMTDVAMVLSLEMRGGGGPSIMFETGAESGWVIDAYRRGSPNAFANSMAHEVYRRMPNGTDFTEFKDEGVQGLNFAAIGRAHLYHQSYDSPQHLSEGTLQHHGVNLLSMLRVFGNEDLATVRAPDPVYFRVPGVGLVVYGARWVIPMTMGLAVLLGLLILVGIRRGLSGKGVVAGLLYSLLVMAAGAGAGWLMLRELPPLHPEYGALLGSLFHSEGWYVLALVGLVTTVAVLALSVLRRWFPAAPLALGASVIPLLAAGGLTFIAPLAAMNLQWPTLALMLAGALLMLLGRDRETGVVGTAGVLLLALPVLVFLVPLVELLWWAMTLRMAVGLGVLVGLACVLLLPALDALRRPNWWWAPVAGLVLSVGFLGLGILNARPTPERPAPSTLVLALDRETGSSLWATNPTAADDAPGMVWAGEQVGEFGPPDTLANFFIEGGAYRTRQADPLALTGPEYELQADGLVEGQRTVRVGIRSTLGAELLTVRVPTTATLTAVNGRPLPTRDPSGAIAEEPVTAFQHWGEPVGALLLDFEVGSAAASLELSVVEHTFRPAELVGAEPFRRPPDLAPNVNLGSDRAMVRSVIRVPLGGEGLAAPQPLGAPATEAGAPTGAGPDDPSATPQAADTTRTPVDSTQVSGPVDTAQAPVPADTTQAPPPPDTTQAPPPPDTTQAPSPPDTTQAPPPADTTHAPTPADSAQAPPDTTQAPASTAPPSPADSTGSANETKPTPPPDTTTGRSPGS